MRVRQTVMALEISTLRLWWELPHFSGTQAGGLTFVSVFRANRLARAGLVSVMDAVSLSSLLSNLRDHCILRYALCSRPKSSMMDLPRFLSFHVWKQPRETL